MALVKDIGVVLRRLDYSETSQVLATFTREHGQQHLIAKGVKRAARGRPSIGIDLLELGQLVFSLRSGKEDNLAPLTEWRQEESFPHLRRDLTSNYAAQYAAEVTLQLTEIHDPHPGLFDGLLAFLRSLADHDPLAALVAYLWLMLREIGLLPELSRCTNCGRPTAGPGPLYFSSRQGGAVCRDCEPAMIEKRRIRPAVAQALMAGVLSDKAIALEAFNLLDYHLAEIMARPAAVRDLLRASIRAGGSR